MDGVDIIFSRIGDPAVIVAVSDKAGGIKAFNLVMRVNVAKLKTVPQGVNACGKVSFVFGIHIRR